MLASSHCTVHPSHEANHRCRSCGCWLCDRCTQSTPQGIFCSGRCRSLFRLSSISSALKRLATDPLEGPWVVGLVGGMIALVIWGVALLASQLVELSRPIPPQAPIQTFRLVESPRGLDVALEGTPGRHAIVVDTSGRTHTLTFNGKGETHLFGIYSPPPAQTATPTPLPVTDQPTSSSKIPMTPKPVPTQVSTHAIATSPATPSTAPSRVPSPTEVADPGPTPTPTPLITPRPRPTTPPGAPPILHLVTDSGPSIAITFDGGASSNRTAELLDLLEELNIKATLFLTGQFIEKHPTLVRRAVLAGHEVGNHTFSHPHLTSWEQDRRHRTLPGITKALLLAELERSERAFQKATGRPMAPLWRAPYGEENPTLRAWALEAGYLHVRWSSLEGRSLDSLDWVEDEHSGLYRDSKRIMNTLLAFPRLEGGIVLMHLASDRDEAPWTHLPEFVKELRKRGIEPTRVTELLHQSKIWRRWADRAEDHHRKLWH